MNGLNCMHLGSPKKRSLIFKTHMCPGDHRVGLVVVGLSVPGRVHKRLLKVANFPDEILYF